MAIYISGIQQMGVGVRDAGDMFNYYKAAFGSDIRVFDDAAEAPLMTRYTGDAVQKRRAVLALNMNGGGGFEIWEYTSRESQPADFQIEAGDLGLYSGKIKSFDIDASHAHHTEMNERVSDIFTNPAGQRHYYITDKLGNIFNIIDHKVDRFLTVKGVSTGGIGGAVIGVSDMDKAMLFYANILHYDDDLSDTSGVFEDLSYLPGGSRKFRRVILGMSQPTQGPFSRMLGRSQVELLQLTEESGRKIFQDRFWGDQGFIHLCYDVQGMDELKNKCETAGHPFTVDSGETFDMGEAGGRFSYIEDPDGTLIEFVETHKLPLLKTPPISFNLRKRPPGKAIPDWILRAMRFNRVKEG